MSIADLMQAIAIVEANPERGSFCDPPAEDLIEAAEAALGGMLPPTYREFVRRFGAGNFGAFEVYGVVNADFESSSVPNGIWLTLEERRSSKLPREFIVVGDTGDGDYYCIRLHTDQESPVIVYQPGYPPEEQRPEEVAGDFGEFFLRGVRSQA